MELVFVGKIIKINKIENSDFLSETTVICGSGGKWTGVVKTADFTLGSLVRVFLPDALLPKDNPEFAFMEAKKYRVRQCRFRGAVSEVLIMPYLGNEPVGTDITTSERVVKFEKPIDPNLAGIARGNFPIFIPKTDEPNFQGVPRMLEELRGKPFIATVKADGSSQTFYKLDGELHVCSRNLELKDTPGNAAWELARKYKLAESLPEGICIQGECVGPKVQGNPMNLSGLELRLFNVYDIGKKCYIPDVSAMSKLLGIPSVEVAYGGPESCFDFTSEELQKMAEGEYYPGKQREGLVFRPYGQELFIERFHKRLSFKVINLLYKEK